MLWLWNALVCLFETLWAFKTVIGVGIALMMAVRAYLAFKQGQRRQKWLSAGKDVVVLHTFGRGRTSPHLSPFGLKLETYLRMAGFTIQIDKECPMGHKGKTPWITLNGEDLVDSQLIIEHLSTNYKNFSSHLTEDQNAVARAFQVMVDEHVVWGLIRWRYLADKNLRVFDISSIFPSWVKLLMPLLQYRMKATLNAQGMGRHTDAEILQIMRKDIKAISDYLGEKPYLMGDNPCEVDCAVFGHLAQFVWNAPDSPYVAMVTDDYPNLHQYCLRMKTKFWPDWDEILEKS